MSTDSNHTAQLQQQQQAQPMDQAVDYTAENSAKNDGFKQFLTNQQLPFYLAARRRILAHSRLIIRVSFLNKCISESLAPTEMVYRPTPPQGIDMTPTEIGAWKSTIVQCGQSMLSIAIDA